MTHKQHKEIVFVSAVWTLVIYNRFHVKNNLIINKKMNLV